MRDFNSYSFRQRDLTKSSDLDDFLNSISHLVSGRRLTPIKLDDFRNMFRSCL